MHYLVIIVILRCMPYYHGHMTPLHSLVYKATDALLTRIEHLPGGYAFWYRLPLHGKHSRTVTRKHFVQSLLLHIFPPDFCTALLRAAILPTGKPNPNASALYKWVLHNFYCNDTQAMYTDWLQIK